MPELFSDDKEEAIWRSVECVLRVCSFAVTCLWRKNANALAALNHGVDTIVLFVSNILITSD